MPTSSNSSAVLCLLWALHAAAQAQVPSSPLTAPGYRGNFYVVGPATATPYVALRAQDTMMVSDIIVSGIKIKPGGSCLVYVGCLTSGTNQGEYTWLSAEGGRSTHVSLNIGLQCRVGDELRFWFENPPATAQRRAPCNDTTARPEVQVRGYYNN